MMHFARSRNRLRSWLPVRVFKKPVVYSHIKTTEGVSNITKSKPVLLKERDLAIYSDTVIPRDLYAYTEGQPRSLSPAALKSLIEY